MTKKLRLIAFFILTCTGCNHLYYHPDDQTYLTPKEVGLKFETLSIASDKERLAAWHIPAVKQPALGKLLHFHGNAQNMTAHFLFVAWLAQEGFDVYVFDYRGYGASTGEATREGLYTDARAAISFVEARDDLPMVIIAQSLGGAVSIPAVATTKTRDLKVLVLDSSFHAYRALAREKLAGFWLTWPLQYPLSFLISDDYSPMDYAGKIKTPVLVIHGTADQIVSYEAGQSLFESFPPENRRLWTINGGGHTSAFQEESPYREKLVSFLRRHLESSDKQGSKDR